MPDRIYLSVCNLQNINLYYSQYFLPLATFQGNKIIPAGKFIAGKAPVDPNQEIEEEHKSGHKMDKPHSAEPKIEVCFGASHECRRITDYITCDAKSQYTQGIDPMINTDR
jgi:hypothetical protein